MLASLKLATPINNPPFILTLSRGLFENDVIMFLKVTHIGDSHSCYFMYEPR